MKETLEELASYVRLAWDRQLTESTGGNMSVRIDDKIYITPTFFIKHFFTVDDFVVLNMDGEKISGKYEASSEYRMHVKIYKEREEIKSVFHAHPRWALIHAVTHKKLPSCILPETIFLLHDIDYLPYCMAGTDEFAEVFSNGLQEGKRTFILENHGVTTIGESIKEAFARLETLETCSFVSVIGSLVKGGIKDIPKDEVKLFLDKMSNK
jgi:L-fuculose-phosphate aldolase